ncbi:MAG: putative beta-lysine N-acetyltransferase [Candidatus Sumerlaeia bacterium]|nr:putative beta-lysine N-acetyltransferase [Candidatus Sumerlaeia bacterium]
MPSWPVILQDGSTVQLPTPYGFEHRIERPGAYEAELLLSPINERIQVLTYQARDLDALTADLLALARRNGYGKVWTKAPATDRDALEAAGFECEGHILGYYKGVDAASMTCFLSEERRFRPHREQEEQILAAALAGEGAKPATHLPDGYTTALFTDADAEELAALYREVFPTYPYPIDDPDYLRATASTHIAYRLVRNEAGRLVAAASAETNLKYRNSEMTDFAALPSERGKGLALFILRALEHDARERFGVRCHYTIARALSFGMLRTFHHAGYVLTGTLVNNCNIAGQFETMHLMCRPPGTD